MIEILSFLFFLLVVGTYFFIKIIFYWLLVCISISSIYIGLTKLFSPSTTSGIGIQNAQAFIDLPVINIVIIFMGITGLYIAYLGLRKK